MSQSMVVREAEHIVHRLESLATTPLVDTSQITLVDFTLSSPELNLTGTPRCKLFEEKTSKKKDTLLENELSMVEEQLAAASLGTSTPLQLSPSVPAFGESFTICSTNAAALEPSNSKGLSPLTRPADIQRKVASPNELLPSLLRCALEDAPSSKPFQLRGAGRLADRALHWLSPSAIENGATGLHALDRATDGNLDSTPPPPLPALGESFVITRESPMTDTVALDGSPTTEATFAISDILPAETTASLAKTDAIIIGAGSLEQSSKSAALAVGTLASEPLPVLGESFTVAGSQATDTEASNGLAVAETTFAVIPDAPPVETAVKEAPLTKMDTTMTGEVLTQQTSSKMATQASRNTPCTPLESLPGIVDSFVVATESLAAGAAASDGSSMAVAVAETTFAIPEPVERAAKQAPSAQTTMIKKAGSLLRQPSSKSAAPAGRSVPLQRLSARLSVSTKPRAVTKGAGDTTFATSVRPPSRQSVTSKAAALSKPGSAFVKASQPAQKWAAPSALAAPRQQATPAVPELPRRSVVPLAGASTALRRSLQPVKGTVGTTARAPARLSTVPDSGAQRTFLHGSRRSVATIRKATTTTSQAVPAEPPKAPTVPQAASTAQPSRLAPRSRLRPPTSRASGSTSRVPRPAAFREASCLPQVPESPVAGRLSSTPARPDVPRCGSTPTLTPIRKQPDWR